jgi:hypothetical protein
MRQQRRDGAPVFIDDSVLMMVGDEFGDTWSSRRKKGSWREGQTWIRSSWWWSSLRRDEGSGITVNLQWEEVLNNCWRRHMVIGEGEEVAGTGGDEGNRVERSFARSDDYSPLKRWTQKDGVGVQLGNVWRRVTGGGGSYRCWPAATRCAGEGGHGSRPGPAGVGRCPWPANRGLIRSKGVLPEFENFQIKYDVEGFKIRNNYPHWNFSKLDIIWIKIQGSS